jgi:hypothetical protein
MPAHSWPLPLDSYNHLIGQPKSAWAWEFLRRNAAYRAEAQEVVRSTIGQSRIESGLRITRLIGPQREAEAWGLYCFRRPCTNGRHHSPGLVS